MKIIASAIAALLLGATHAAAQVTSDPCRAAGVRSFIALGVGGFILSGRFERHEASFEGARLSMQLGMRLSRRLLLVGRADFSDDPTTTGPTMTEAHSVFSIGLRWAPFEPRPSENPESWTTRYFDPAAFQFELGAGLAVRDSVTYVDDKGHYDASWAPVVAGAVGWVPLQGLDYAAGFELHGEVAYRDGIDAALALVVVVQLMH